LPGPPKTIRPKEKALSTRLNRLDNKMGVLDRRMDRLAEKFKHRSQDLKQRLERLRQEVDEASADYPSFFRTFKKEWLISWGSLVVKQLCMGVAVALHSHKAQAKSKRDWTPVIFSDDHPLLAEVARTLLPENKVQPERRSRMSKSDTEKEPLAVEGAVEPEAPNPGSKDETWESASRLQSSARDSLTQLQSDDMNNLVHEDTLQQPTARALLDEGKLSGLRRENGHEETSFRMNEATCSHEQRARDYRDSSRSANKSSNVYTEQQFEADGQCIQTDGRMGEQDSWLEAIKPEVTLAPLSRLEAVSGRIPLNMLSVWNDVSSQDVQLGQTPSKGVICCDASELTLGARDEWIVPACVLKSVRNPFFNSIRPDSWVECDRTLELRMPHSSPNLAYGFESLEETPQASVPFNQFGVEELKTKWISLNDFV